MSLNVKLLEYTNNPERIIAAAAKLCYSGSHIDELLDNMDDEKITNFINRLASYGHESPMEHVTFTFAVEGVSRSLTHQLVRHRLASYSQQSQRYVKLNQFEYIIPPEIEKDNDAKKIFIEAMKNDQKAYDDLAERLKNKYVNDGMKERAAEKNAIEDARYVFPNACETKIMVTMNARELFHFFNQRCCMRAQWEIRNLAFEMLKLAKKAAPTIFKFAGPGCVRGNCPEGKMSCGKAEEIRKKYLKEV